VEPIFSELETSVRKLQLLKALSQNDFRRCSEAWEARGVVCSFQWNLLWRRQRRYSSLVNKIRLRNQSRYLIATPHSVFQVEVFWVLMLCSVAVRYLHFGGPCSPIFRVKWMALCVFH